ncbi:hypothetical protein [Paraglaciecola sp.]|uniref:hypothetical protein n=1 Tax=Paraglaciecola sp. TaxID=1920173 RepID=UPI0030F4A466
MSGDFTIDDRKIFVISGILNVEGADDHRTYLIDGKSRLMVLFQLGDVDVTKQVVFKNVVRAL